MTNNSEQLGNDLAAGLVEKLSPGTVSVLSLFQSLSALERYNALMLCFGLWDAAVRENHDMLSSLKNEDLRAAAGIFMHCSNTLESYSRRSPEPGVLPSDGQG